MTTPTSEDLRKALEAAFPRDAKSWGQATDEIRDMSRAARETLGYGETLAVDFQSADTPAKWNRLGVDSVVNWYAVMSRDQRREYLERFSSFVFIAAITPLRPDHAALAALISEQITTANSNMQASGGSGSQWARGDELMTRSILLARAFAEVDGVGAEGFLKACGVEP